MGPPPDFDDNMMEVEQVQDIVGVGRNKGEGDLDKSTCQCFSVPQVEADLTPFLGKEFDSEEEAKFFYVAYARACGFSVRINWRRLSKKDGKPISRHFVCSKEGFRREDVADKKRVIPITREGCKAMMQVSRRNSGKWVVTKFEDKHVHEMMTLGKVCRLRPQRNVSKSKGQVHERQKSLCMSTSDVVDVMREESAGINKGSCIERDRRNCVEQIQKKICGNDAQIILDYFKNMQSKNPLFYYAVQVDDKNHITNCLWIDARSRMAYHHFGDVVLFDTTYKTNKYLVPFAPFIGVNHHQQSILFGCTFLLDETEESFTWLFQTWLEAMSCRPPQVIIADQDPAMRAAIGKVLPQTHHRFCMWRILQKIPDKLTYLYHKHSCFEQDFNDCIYLPETGEEFERCWDSLVTAYQLKENDWLQMMYEIREKWVPAYLRNIFLAEMSTTLQGESMKFLFDGYVTKQTTLQEFVVLYEKIMENLLSKEREADSLTLSSEPVLKTPLYLEEHAANIYSREVFLKFQDELWKSLTYGATKLEDNGHVSKYKVENFAPQKNHQRSKYWMENFGQQKRLHIVTLIASENKASCSCHKFEFAGIVCRHILAVFKVVNIWQLPSHYMLKRWTRHVKIGLGCDAVGFEIEDDCAKSLTMRYDDLCHLANKCAEKGAKSLHGYNIAKRALERCLAEIPDEEQESDNSEQLMEPVSILLQDVSASKESQSTISVSNAVFVNSQVTNMNQEISNARSKNPKEMKEKRTPKCKYCEQGVHDKQTCPKLKGEGEFLRTNGGGIGVSIDAPPISSLVTSHREGARSRRHLIGWKKVENS